MSKFSIPLSQSVLVAGGNGSGKTFLAEKYLSSYKNVVVLDTKGFIDWPEVPDKEKTLVEKLADLPKVTTPKILYRPRFQELTKEYYEKFFEWCYLRMNCTVWVDEVMSICENSHYIPPYYKGILTRGRQRMTNVWSLTQRPKEIPQVILSESYHYFIFRLQLDQDRERLVDITGFPEFMTQPQGHDFWYCNLAKAGSRPVMARLVENKNGGQLSTK